jgi:cytochrome b561
MVFTHYQNIHFFHFHISFYIFLGFIIMPRKYVRIYSENPRASWSEETLRQAIAQINAGEIGIREAER